ncbi:alkaline phosphatase family protein [uncultured Clostridium sp.]|jgi:predicted AlkP superfamily pyrophosphatase or phosphodiesterase|uniref:alkaline phosphatase family protein n=1 Tax=uncultured Clostridium sp. TaxID=59620 RepID=UPI002607E970|nr:ectonucleotide pyrophosphatase/phosphodiesterase [uncultured Clostridium sp.]
MNKKKFIIISFDAVDGNDLAFLSKLPHFGKLLKRSSYSTEVESVYPSLTYPVHTSIITGMLPKNHNVINNIKIQVSNCLNPDWFWKKSEIKGDTLFDVIKRNKLTCSSILWPVTCQANIKYNMPEIFPNKGWQNQIMVSALNGSIKYQLNLNNKFASIREGLRQPQLDNFSMNCFLYTLTEYMPDVAFLHLTDVDTNRHKHGYKSKEANYALMRHDARLGDVITKLQTIDSLDDACIILLGDHSMKETHSVIKLNKLFLDKCWLGLDKTNKKIDYHEVFCNFCDGSAYIYLKDKNNKTLLEKVTMEINKLSETNFGCIKSIYNKQEATKFGADPNCDLMIEANDGYYFINNFDGDKVIEKVGTKYDKSTHGYKPSNYENGTFFIVCDPRVKEDFNIGPMRIIDIAPTITKLLDDAMLDTDGKLLRCIFK